MYWVTNKSYTFDRTGSRLIATYEAIKKMLVAMDHLHTLESYFTQKELAELRTHKLI